MKFQPCRSEKHLTGNRSAPFNSVSSYKTTHPSTLPPCCLTNSQLVNRVPADKIF